MSLLLASCGLAQMSFAQMKVVEPAIKAKSSFAIIIDKMTYEKTGAEVMSYKNSIEKQGLPVYLAVSEWKNPDEIRSYLSGLYKTAQLEGAVFIGDIPIPMLRDAQHMTSAFKIDQKSFTWAKTSVPSDRFYEDFDLKFKYLKQDSLKKLLYYYSLLPESPQKISKEIYTARIKPSAETGDKFELIKNYLKKVVKAKQLENRLDSMLVFTGHGYNSESIPGYTDEILGLREQFPDMFVNGKGRLKKLNHTMSRDMKKILLTELQNPALDVAMFHAHGEYDTQYLIEYPTPANPDENIEDVKLYLRSKMREAKRRKKNPEEVKEYFIKSLDVKPEWFDGAFSDSVITRDSILAASLDIYSSDVRTISPQAKLMIFDECFNGSLHRDDYIAGEYVFGNGGVIAGVANSTNALQDQWVAQFMGLLTKGVSLGQWHKFNPLLESHLFGDPTFRFSYSGKQNIAALLRGESRNTGQWEKLLGDQDPNLRALALSMLYKVKGAGYAPELKKIFLSDPAFIVRLHALMCLSSCEGKEFYDVLNAGANDQYEAIRKYSASLMGEVGSEEFIERLVKLMLADESPRVSSNAKNSLMRINPLKAMEVTNRYIDSMPAQAGREPLKARLSAQFKNENKTIFDELLVNVKADTLALKYRLRDMKTFRGYNYKQAVKEITGIVESEKYPNDLRILAAEVLGWYSVYFDKASISAACIRTAENKNNSEILRNEALKTANRLKAGLNSPLIP